MKEIPTIICGNKTIWNEIIKSVNWIDLSHRFLITSMGGFMHKKFLFEHDALKDLIYCDSYRSISVGREPYLSRFRYRICLYREVFRGEFPFLRTNNCSPISANNALDTQTFGKETKGVREVGRQGVSMNYDVILSRLDCFRLDTLAVCFIAHRMHLASFLFIGINVTSRLSRNKRT